MLAHVPWWPLLQSAKLPPEADQFIQCAQDIYEQGLCPYCLTPYFRNACALKECVQYRFLLLLARFTQRTVCNTYCV